MQRECGSRPLIKAPGFWSICLRGQACIEAGEYFLQTIGVVLANSRVRIQRVAKDHRTRSGLLHQPVSRWPSLAHRSTKDLPKNFAENASSRRLWAGALRLPSLRRLPSRYAGSAGPDNDRFDTSLAHRFSEFVENLPEYVATWGGLVGHGLRRGIGHMLLPVVGHGKFRSGRVGRRLAAITNRIQNVPNWRHGALSGLARL